MWSAFLEADCPFCQRSQWQHNIKLERGKTGIKITKAIKISEIMESPRRDNQDEDRKETKVDKKGSKEESR